MKGIKLFLFVLLSLCLAAVAMADDDVSANASASASAEAQVDSETEEEVIAASSGLGAKIRLLQLEKAVSRKIIEGDAIIAAVAEANSTVNTSKLGAIIAELEVLKQQVSDARASVNGSANASAAAQQFVGLKHDAINLTHEFRHEAHAVIKASDILKIRKRISELKDDSEILRLRNETKLLIRQHNAVQLERLLARMNVSDSVLIERIEAGSVTKADVKAAVRSAFRNLSSEEKAEASIKIREDVSKRIVFRKAVVEGERKHHFERKHERIEARIELANERHIRVRALLKAGLEAEKDLLEDLMEARKEIREEMKEEKDSESGSRVKGDGSASAGVVASGSGARVEAETEAEVSA